METIAEKEETDLVAALEPEAIDNRTESEKGFLGEAMFFKKGKQKPLRVAEKLIEHFKAITMEDTNEIYYYNSRSGLYEPAEPKFLEGLQLVTDEDISVRFQNEVLNCVRNATRQKREDLAVPINLIAVNNGIFDLKTSAFKPFTPEMFFTSKLPANYNPDAKCPKINEFISQIAREGDITALKEFPAYCLLREYPIHKSFMLVGTGENGKGTYLNIISLFFGEKNISNATLQELASDRFSCADLYGKNANFCADLEKNALRNTGLFKMLSGDEINAQRKFGQRFKFRNYAKLAFSANQIPATPDDTIAFHRRWRIIEFPYRFTAGKNANQNLLKELTTQEEMSGFLNQCIELLPKLLKRGDFDGGVTPEESRIEYTRRSDNLATFIKECLEYEVTAKISKDELYLAYVKYCKGFDMTPVSKESVGRTLPGKVTSILEATIGQCRVGEKSNRGWSGLKIIEKGESSTL